VLRGELIGVELALWLWLFLGGETGAHKNGVELLFSRELLELCGSAGINVFVSAGMWPFSALFLGMSFKLYFKWLGSRGLQNDNSSGWRIPTIFTLTKHFKIINSNSYQALCTR
jgi:hypothetical protein